MDLGPRRTVTLSITVGDLSGFDPYSVDWWHGTAVPAEIVMPDADITREWDESGVTLPADEMAFRLSNEDGRFDEDSSDPLAGLFRKGAIIWADLGQDDGDGHRQGVRWCGQVSSVTVDEDSVRVVCTDLKGVLSDYLLPEGEAIEVAAGVRDILREYMDEAVLSCLTGERAYWGYGTGEEPGLVSAGLPAGTSMRDVVLQAGLASGSVMDDSPYRYMRVSGLISSVDASAMRIYTEGSSALMYPIAVTAIDDSEVVSWPVRTASSDDWTAVRCGDSSAETRLASQDYPRSEVAVSTLIVDTTAAGTWPSSDAEVQQALRTQAQRVAGSVAGRAGFRWYTFRIHGDLSIDPSEYVVVPSRSGVRRLMRVGRVVHTYDGGLDTEVTARIVEESDCKTPAIWGQVLALCQSP